MDRGHVCVPMGSERDGGRKRSDERLVVAPDRDKQVDEDGKREEGEQSTPQMPDHLPPIAVRRARRWRPRRRR